MSRTVIEIRTIDFDCATANGPVEVLQTFKVRLDRRGEEQARIVASTGCSHSDACPGVSKRQGNATSFDWTKCLWLQSR